MSTFDAAESRLGAALARLEAVLGEGGVPPVGGSTGHAAGDGGGLRVECERLSEALDKAQRENQDLRKAATGMADKLDTSIHQLDLILED
jgi:hypothetical protein